MRRGISLALKSCGSEIGLLALTILIFPPASALAQTSQAQGLTPSTATPTVEQLEGWHKGIVQVPQPHPGCFTSSYPSTQWQEIPCSAPPERPYPPSRGGARAGTVGNGNDVSAQAAGLISQAVGSFDTVAGVTSETGQVNGVGGQVANTFSLQLNTNFFFNSPTCNGAANPSKCQAWEQFVYTNSGSAFIQYWLINYNTTCPGGWNTFAPDCWRNGSNGVGVPSQNISNLVHLSLTGQASSGGQDTITMSVGSTVYSAQNPDSMLFLAQGWTAAEFNIVGDCCSSQANFNNGSTLVVRTSVNSGTLNAPSCLGQGFTGETNNLNFAPPPAAKQGTLPAILFTQSSSGGAASPCAASIAVAGASALGNDPLAHTHDFNGDAKSDILWRDVAGDVGLWLMNGGSILQGSAFNAVSTNWSIVGQRDFNGDGKSDILWRDTVGDVGMWLMNGTQIVQGGSFSAIPLNWSVAGTGDFNGDGKADILWIDNQGNVGIWFMNGTQILQAGVVGQLPPNWIIVGSDMKGDIFLRNISSGDVGMWVMNGSHISQSVDFGPMSLNWTVAGIGDFDGNGSFDLLWRDTAGDVAIWLLNGTSVISTTTFGNLPTSWNIAETGDFNGDGRSDILWVDNSGHVGIWFMSGTNVSSVNFYGNIGTNWTVQALGAN